MLKHFLVAPNREPGRRAPRSFGLGTSTACYPPGVTQGILLVDHGSRRAASNALLGEVAERIAAKLPEGTLIEPAHMELASPTIAEAFDQLVARGASEVVVVPYFLSPGRHATEDVPRLAAEAAARHPEVAHRVAPPLGPHDLLEQLVLVRAGVRSAQ